MKVMYFFDDKIKRHIMKGKKYCNPAETGNCECGISCIRQGDVNLWFYTKNNTTIAIDAGHLNFPKTSESFRKINIDPTRIPHVFITHADVDHCGGIDIKGSNIYPNAKIHIGKEETVYLNRQTYRMKKGNIKLYNCVALREGYETIDGDKLFDIDGIKIQAVHTPGHTLGHTCYIIDDTVLFSGDCLAVNEQGGYSFFDFFTQFPDMNKKSLLHLQKIVSTIQPRYVCTGHSGIRKYSPDIFAHAHESAQFSLKKPFDPYAPYDAFTQNTH